MLLALRLLALLLAEEKLLLNEDKLLLALLLLNPLKMLLAGLTLLNLLLNAALPTVEIALAEMSGFAEKLTI